MYCRKCGKEVIGDAEYCSNCVTLSVEKLICPYCGKETSASNCICEHCASFLKTAKKTEAKPSVNMKTCLNCGGKIPKSAIYCPKCHTMPDTKSAPKQSSVYDEDNSSTAYNEGNSFILGILVGFLLSFIGLLIAWVKGNSEVVRGAKYAVFAQLIVGVIVLLVRCVIIGA